MVIVQHNPSTVSFHARCGVMSTETVPRVIAQRIEVVFYVVDFNVFLYDNFSVQFLDSGKPFKMDG